MALNEMEFMGNDRYFKYRYAQETPVNVTTVEESWAIDDTAQCYIAIGDYLRRSLNMKVCYEEHKHSYFEADKLVTEPDFFNNANIILIPTQRSFFDGRQEHFSPAPVFRTARTIIVSAAPKKVTSTSLSFLNVDTPVVILMGSALILLSLLLVIHSILTNKYKSVSKRKILKKQTKETLENVWDNASLLCAEPITFVLPHITCRLLAASWLIGVTFILFFLGCYLRTEFTTESYNCIDTLSDLIESGIPSTMIKEAGTLEHLKYSQDPVVKQWLDAQDQEKLFTDLLDYVSFDGYSPILSGEKALIIKDLFLTWLMPEFFNSESVSKVELLANNGGFYFSQYEVGFEYLHQILNTSWMRSSPQVHENLQLSPGPWFETQVFKYTEFQKLHTIEQVTWKRPLKIATNLDLSSVFVPFNLLFMLLSGTVAAVITEIIFNHIA